MTWGSADDEIQSYITGGKHGVMNFNFDLLKYLYILKLFMFELISFSCNAMAPFVKKTPEAFLLPSEASIVKAAAGWAHCVSVTGNSFSFSLSFQF